MERNLPRPHPEVRSWRAPEVRKQWVEVEIPEELASRTKVQAQITLRNSGNLTGRLSGYSPVRVGYRWLDSAGREVPGQDMHSPSPTLEPGEFVTAGGRRSSGRGRGIHLQLDLVQEELSWLSAQGEETVEINVTVK